MNDNEKRDFAAVIKKTAAMYDKDVSMERIGAYWAVLSGMSLNDVMTAINLHAQDTERGRFFPLPADILAKLPSAPQMWPEPNEAWAMVPKDEASSTVMCAEMAEALGVAQELIGYGDMVAARMAFLDAYRQRVSDSKAQGKRPEWFISPGEDKTTRDQAEIKLVQMKNLSLPPSERLALPEHRQEQQISLEQLGEKMQEKASDPEMAKKQTGAILDMLRKK